MATSSRQRDSNPGPGDLVWDINVPLSEGPLIVLDFFPWGLHGCHAWSTINPKTGKKRILTKKEISMLK